MSGELISDYETGEAKTRASPSIASFAVEILAVVMSYAIRTPDVPNTIQLLRLCHVCRYWRNVCMSTPHLWSSVDASNPKIGQVFLRHCRDTPIDLYATREHRFSPFWPADIDAKTQLTQLLSSHWPQVRSLMFDASDALLEVLQDTATNMPLLESIRLHTTTYHRILNWTPIVGDNHSHVHTLDLEGVYIPLETRWFRDMVQLTVRLPQPIPTPPTMEAFVEILVSSPRMQILVLEWAGPNLQQGCIALPFPVRVVALPNLVELHLTNRPHDIAYLLSNIRISPPTRVFLTCETEDYAACLPILFFAQSTLFNYTPASQIVRLEVNDEHPRVAIHAKALEIVIRAHYPFATRDDWLSQLPPTASNLWDLYPPASTSLTGVHVFVGESWTLNKRDWVGIIGHRNLMHIDTFGVSSLGEQQFGILLSALYSRAPWTSAPYFPSLQRLLVPHLSTAEAAAMCKYLQWRVQNGVSLRTLEVACSQKDWARGMRHLVGDIIWKPRVLPVN